MSWEVMRSETKECPCGKGTITDSVEMDDWNRTRSSMVIDCPDCREKAAREAEEHRQKKLRNEALYSQAKGLAIGRYLRKWLDFYSGLTKKAAWQCYTGGSGYPALGTFYKHVKDAAGVPEYMRWCFEIDIEGALRKMSIEDNEIDELLSQRSEEPPTALRHPYD